MSVSIKELGIDQLSVRERLELIEQICDSLPVGVAPDEMPEWHKEVLAERLAEAEANCGGGACLGGRHWPRSGLADHEPTRCFAALG